MIIHGFFKSSKKLPVRKRMICFMKPKEKQEQKHANSQFRTKPALCVFTMTIPYQKDRDQCRLYWKRIHRVIRKGQYQN